MVQKLLLSRCQGCHCLSPLQCAAPNLSTAFFVQLTFYPRYRSCYSERTFRPCWILQRFRNTNESKGQRWCTFFKSILCPWQQAVIVCALFEQIEEAGTLPSKEHTHTHTQKMSPKPFLHTHFFFFALSSSTILAQFSYLRSVFLELHATSLVPSLYLSPSLFLFLSLSCTYTQCLINISNFGRSNYFEISTLLCPQASPVSSLPWLPPLSPRSQH